MVDQLNSGKKNSANNAAEDSTKEEEWEFTTVKPTIKYEENTVPQGGESQVKDTKVVARRKPQLSLDEATVPKMKTRSEMAAELMKNNIEEDEELSFVLASIPKRAIAFIIDMVILAIIGIVVFYTAPISRKILQTFLDRYKLELFFPESVMMNIILTINGIIAIFFFVVIPVAFYNHSFGKKLLGLKVRSAEKFRVNLPQAWQRELIYKPLGILLVIGFFIPFFNKKKQALHDLLAETLVIEK